MSRHRPTLLVLGHVTRDVFDEQTRLGGAASYAARAGALLGLDTALVSVAPAGAPELEPLRETPSLQVALAPSETITTFALDYSGEQRRLSLLERARSLRLADVPAEWRNPDVLYVGTVAGECEADLISAFGGAYVIAGIQGWLRDPLARGPVREHVLPAALEPPPNLKVACFSASDHSSAASIAERLTALGIVVAVTEGRGGARVTWGQHAVHVAAAPAREIDPTGAGDVFSLVFGLSLWAGHAPPEAARRAAVAAARVVEGPGLGQLASAREELALTG